MSPKCENIDTAIRIYYKYSEIGNPEMRELFGKNVSARTLARYKQEIYERQNQLGIKNLLPHYVNTKVAYEVWGMNIEDLEKRRAKLKKLGLDK